MKKLLFISIILFFQILTLSAQQISLRTDDLNLTISSGGQLTEMLNPSTRKNYLPIGEKAPLLRIRVGSEWEDPARAVFNSKSGVITLNFPVSKISAEIKVTQNKSHLSFRLIRLNAKEKVNAVCWGSYPTIIGKTIGEVIGVVRDGDFAIGLQTLNSKTLGGVLKNDEGADESRGSVAISQPYRSSLQAFSLDRSKIGGLPFGDRIIPTCRLRQYPTKQPLVQQLPFLVVEKIRYCRALV